MIEKVLLIGEASGVHRNLAKGLRQLGVEARHVVQSDGSSWTWYDEALAHISSGVAGGIRRNVEPFWKLARMPHYDVINLTNTITSVIGLQTRYLDLPILRHKSRLLAYYALGCDEVGLIRRNPVLPYTPCAGCLADDRILGNDCKNILNPRWERSNADVKRYYDFGASSMIEYDHTSALFDRFERIGFPFDCEGVAFDPARDRPKPLIVHTPTRRGFKGTDQVLEAMHILAQKRSDYRFEIVEGLSYDAYLERMRDADIVIDQIWSQSPGMNGLAMMASGKIVFTGATELGRSFLPAMTDMPLFDAPPEPALLAQALDRILARKDRFGEIAAAGRAYVEQHHGVVAIARQFLDSWSTALADKEARSPAADADRPMLDTASDARR